MLDKIWLFFAVLGYPFYHWVFRPFFGNQSTGEAILASIMSGILTLVVLFVLCILGWWLYYHLHIYVSWGCEQLP